MVIDLGINRKRVYIGLLLLVINSNLDPILHRFRDGGLNVGNRKFYTPLLFRLKVGGVSLE